MLIFLQPPRLISWPFEGGLTPRLCTSVTFEEVERIKNSWTRTTQASATLKLCITYAYFLFCCNSPLCGINKWIFYPTYSWYFLCRSRSNTHRGSVLPMHGNNIQYSNTIAKYSFVQINFHKLPYNPLCGLWFKKSVVNHHHHPHFLLSLAFWTHDIQNLLVVLWDSACWDM